VEGQDAGVDPEQCVPAQYFHVSVFEVEGIVGGYGRGVDGKFVIGSICDREVGYSGDADGWRASGGGRGSGVCLWGSDEFEWREMRVRNLRFEVSLRKSQGCGNRSCTGVLLAPTSRFRFPGFECRRREIFPATVPLLNYLLKICFGFLKISTQSICSPV